MNDLILNITKDFGNTKSLKNIWKLEKQGSVKNLSSYIEEDILNCEILYVCAADYNSDKIMDYISNNTNRNFRIYFLTKQIDTRLWDNNPLKNKIIIREVPDLNGNYFFTENKLYFTDKECNGVFFDDENLIKEIKKIFINEFWNYATKEYICGELIELKDENKYFDIPPVLGNDILILNQGVEEKSSVEKIFENAQSIFIKSLELKTPLESIMPDMKTISVKNINSEIKSICEDLNKNNKRIFYSPYNNLNFVQTNNSVYVCNFNFSDIDFIKRKRDSRLFMLKVEDMSYDDIFDFHKYSYGKLYEYMPDILFKDSVDEELIDFNKKTIVIKEIGEPEDKCTPVVDIRTIRRNGKKIEKWKQFLESIKIFETKQLAISVDFNITIPPKKRTFKDAAEIYKKYDEAGKYMLEKMDTAFSEIVALEKKAQDNKKKKEKDLSNITTEIEKLNKEEKVCDSKLIELNKQKEDFNKNKKKFEKDELIAKNEKTKNQINSKRKTMNSTKTAIETEISKAVEELNTILRKKTEIEKLKNSFNNNINTIADIENNNNLVSHGYKLIEKEYKYVKNPDFDKPKYGILYQKGNEYQYEVDKEENLDDAESESRIWNIENVLVTLK